MPGYPVISRIIEGSPMPYLKLISLECHDTEDDTGADEAYIRINGRRVWKGNINDNQSKDLGSVERIEFTENSRIDLYDEDVGGFDPDDHLGTQYVWARQVDHGEQHLSFSGSRWNYTLHCRIETT
jgi:hypothetical protein